MPATPALSASLSQHQEALRALALVDSDPQAALRLANEVLGRREARPGAGDRGAFVVAHRAAALALRETGDAAAARRHLVFAIRIAQRNGLPGLAVESRISLAFLESEAGRTSRALALLDLSEVSPGSVDEVRVATTRGLVLQRVGRHAPALRQYDQALELASTVDDPVQTARILNNRAMSLAYLGETDRALSDLKRAATLYAAFGASALAADAVANEAWVLGMAGDVPASLRAFDRARSVDDADDPERWTDRAEVYLRAGLHGDAARSAQRAVEMLDRRGWAASEAEAVLLLARCRFALGDHSGAASEASRAAAMFRAQGRVGWLPLATYIRVRAETGDGSTRTKAVTTLSRQLWDAGWRLPALDVVIGAAVSAIAQGHASEARRLLDSAPLTPTRRMAPELRSRRAFGRALQNELAGDPAAAQRLLRSSFREIERRRALLGAADMRALSSTLATDVVDAGVRMALERGDAREVFTWAERSRAAAFRYRPVLPDPDGELRESLTRLRWATRALEDSRLQGVVDRVALAEAARWEGEVMRRTRRASGDTTVSTLRLPELRRHLNDGAFVHLVIHGERVISSVLTSRSVTLREHGTTAELRRMTRRIRTGAERAARGGAWDLGALAALSGLLWAPVADICGGRRLMISAPADMADVPWGAVPGFSDQVLTVVPSAQAWLSCAERAPRRQRVAAVAGPGLPAAATEVASVVAAYRRGRALSGSDATAAALLAAFASTDVLHVAAHGRLRTDNPLFSSLELHDGQVTAYDLQQLRSLPSTVVLSCCHAGSTHPVAPGESLGLASTLLRLDVRTVVASVASIDDSASAPVMERLHERIASGDDAASALARVQRDRDPTSLAFVAYGA